MPTQAQVHHRGHSELVRLAERERCLIETVSDSDVLKLLGGVGCLLRYRLPDEYA